MSEPKLIRPTINGRKSGVWYVVYWEGRSRRVSTGCAARLDAQAWLSRWSALRVAPPSSGSVLELCQAYEEARVAEGARADTMNWALKPVLPHFGGLKAHEVSAPFVRGYLVKRRSAGVADSTIGRELRTLRAALNWGEREGWIDRAPKFNVPGESAPSDRWLTKHEFTTIQSAAKALHVKTFMALAVNTGARMGAVLRLNWMQVDFDNRLIHFRRTDPNARKRISPKPMNSTLYEALTTARQFARTPHVIEWNGARVTKIQNAVKRAAVKAEIPDVCVHDYRRTCAVWMLHAGASFSQVAALLDDSVQTVQKHYAHHAPGYLRDTLEKM